MIIRRAVSSDAAALADLAARTFSDTFASQNTPEDMASYLAKSFGEEQQRREIEDPSIVTLVMESGGALIAYAMLKRSDSQYGDVELARLYVSREHHGGGIARTLMNAALDAAYDLGGATVWLGVWERNPRAIRFYEKSGFRDIGSHPFLLGSDLQTDRIMTFDLDG